MVSKDSKHVADNEFIDNHKGREVIIRVVSLLFCNDSFVAFFRADLNEIRPILPQLLDGE